GGGGGWAGERGGPAGGRHEAPGVQVHHGLMCRRSTGPGVIVNTSEPGTRFSGGAPGKSAGSRGRSATVTYPVCSTKAANRRFVTWTPSIQKPSTATERTGASSR